MQPTLGEFAQPETHHTVSPLAGAIDRLVGGHTHYRIPHGLLAHPALRYRGAEGEVSDWELVLLAKLKSIYFASFSTRKDNLDAPSFMRY